MMWDKMQDYAVMNGLSILVPRVFLRHCADQKAEGTPWYTSIKCAQKTGALTAIMDLQFARQR